MAKVFSELNVAYNTSLDANASISFVKIDDKHYLKVEGKENSPIKVGFNRICEASANFPGSEIRIPIRGQDDLVVKFDNSSGVSTVGVATATFNTSYDIGYGKGIYGPILFGTDVWNAWPTSDKNVDAYFFKGDKGRIFLRVNAKSKKPQKVLLKIKQVQTGQTLGKVRIPYTALNSVVPNTQSEANNNLFDFVYDASKNTDGDGFVRTLLFENIYYPKAGSKSGQHFASGNVYGPIEFYHVKKDKPGEVDDIRYTLLEEYNEAIKKKLGQNPTQWVIRKNGRELGVIESSASEKDATNSIDEDFHLRIEDIKIVDAKIDSAKKGIIWDNYEDITNDTGKLDIGDTSAYFNIINGSQELSITDGAGDVAAADKDFSLVIGQIDDNLIAKLDVYHFGEQEGNNNRPVVIGIHAGAWTTNQNKDEFLGSKAKFFRKKDCIFVNVEYRVSPPPPPNKDGVFNGYDKNRIKFPAHIEDIAASVKWVRDNIAKYGGDPNNVILYGHGSGAHLATLLVTNKKWLNEIGVDPAIIKGCISSSNIAWNIKNELDKYSDSLVPDTKVSIYNAFGIDPVVGGAEAKVDFESTEKAKEAYDSYSPDLHLQKELFPPILILSRGGGATLQRADDFVKKLDSVGIASTSVFHYKYPDNKTYSQTSIAGVVGVTPDPPSGYALPKNTISVSQAISDFLTNKISFKFPDNAIIDYPIIDGQVYSAVSGISTVPIAVSIGATSASNPSSDASQAGDGAKQIQLSGGGIFGAPGTDAIQIGYIDPTLGYVTGLSICEANNYAQENQGTTFVAVDGDNNVNYLNINDVNKLTADFAKSSAKCDGLKATIKCGEPILNIYGGGGVGAKANIIIGKDGSVMGVDLVHKGYGYQYPPLVQAVDKCYFGNGATFEAFLGEISTKEETFDKESDFEDYYVCPPGTNFGTLYDASGKEVGKWDPSLYTNPSANPIAKQVADYETLINQVKKPWWTTRMKKPSKLTGTKDKSLTVFPVSHPCEIKTVSLEPPKQSTKQEKKILLEYELADDIYLGTAKGGTKVVGQKGTKSVTAPSNATFFSNTYGPWYQGTKLDIKAQVGGSGNLAASDWGLDTDPYKKYHQWDSETRLTLGKYQGKVDEWGIKVWKKKKTSVSDKQSSKSVEDTKKQSEPEKTWNDFMNDYAISPVSPSNVPGTDFASTMFTMEWDQIFPYDGEYIFRGCADGSVKELYLDNEKITTLKSYNENFAEVKKEVKGGLHTIRVDIQNGGFTETKLLPFIVDFTVKGEASKNGSLLDNIFFTFTSEDGKDSFTFKAREKNQDISKESSLSSSVKAKFVKKGKDIYLDVTGSGTGKIDFLMDVNDQAGVAGFAAKEVKIPAEGSNVSLKRSSSLPQKEKVKASGSFKAGQTYGPIQVIGAASGAGSPKVTSNEIGLLDADGSDKNIKITFETKGTASKGSLQWERLESVKIRPNVVYNVKASENTSKYKGVEQGLFKTKKGDSQEVGGGSGNKIFADFLGSDNDNDDIQVIAGEGVFKSFNKKKTKDGSRNTYDLTFVLNKKESDLGKSTKEDIFDTVSYIDKADRKLWKTNPKAGKDANFSDKYGVSPFDTDTKEAQKESYAGTHVIRWEKINFPVDGTYDIEVAVDDNVKIYIGNKKTGGKIEDGSGLKSAADGGDEEIFDVKGFSSPGVSKGKQIFSRKFKAGDYRIRTELEQIDVGALAKGNPMMLAIKITKKEGGTKDIISKKSWCENPLGAAVTIEAPPVPVPQEPAIVFDKCPPTPMWTTRQPKAEKTWYPVKYNGYKSFIDQVSKVPKKETTISAYQNVEFLVFGEGTKGDKNLKYLEFLFESTDGKESFVLKGVEPEKDKKTAQYRIDKKIKKNLKYKVTAKISDTKKAGFTQVEQGLGVLKGKSVDEASKSKKSGTVIFADFIGASNDNDDIRVSVSKGDGEFTVGKKSTIGGRTTFELFYELESKATIGSKKKVEIKPKFIKDKKDGKIYLDMSEYPEQEYELDFKFIMADTIKGGKGLAASKFEIAGTNIQYNRYKNGKLVTNDTVKKSFKIKGGKKYGPVIFSGADKGASTQLISADQIASYDKKSTDNFNEKTKKTIDAVDFNVILTDVSGVEFKEPKNIEGWSKFMNRYAISPVQPLYAPGTDGGGVNYDNSWDVEFPYDGFYKFEAQADNKAAVYVDGTAVLTNVVNFKETVSSNKVFVSKGKHKVKVEVENEKTEVYDTIDEKIFSTKDNVSDDNTKEVIFTVKGEANKNASLLDDIYFTFISDDGKDSFTFNGREKNQKVSGNTDAIKAKFKKVGNDIFLEVTGSGGGQIKFEMDVNDNPFTAGSAATEVKIPSEGSTISLKRTSTKSKETIKASGKFKAGQTYGPIQVIGAATGAGKPIVTSKEIGLLDADGNDKNIKINFDIVGSSSKLQWEREEKVTIRTNVTYKVKAHENTKKYKGVEQGLFKTKKGDSQEVGEGKGNKIFADFLGSDNDNDDIQIIVDDGEFRSFNKKKTKDGSRNTYDLEFTLKTKSASKGSGTSGKGKYSGPELDYNFTHKGWSEFMNKYNVVPASKSAEGATYNLKWSGVEFPSDGQYEYKIQADNLAVLLIDGKEVGKTTEFKGSPSTKYFDASKGKRTIEIVLTNSPDAKTFDINPTGVALFISKKASKISSKGKSWLENPMGVSAVIIPPPCPKLVGGKGVIDKIVPTNPGTGYTSPPPGATPSVPVLMPLTEIIVKEPGINYNCSEDPIVITPSNGAVLSYKCNPFGKITEVIVEEPGEPFTEYPTISIVSPTGTGVVLTPVFTPTIAPPGAPPEKIIQVTDLVGLKQTGWIDGRPYYGAVFSENGLLYTGYYKTVGKLVRVYATLEESITGEVVTPPSAILRTGTDVTNNDPRLDIPGTPGGLVS
jgi:hypothetical protein